MWVLAFGEDHEGGRSCLYSGDDVVEAEKAVMAPGNRGELLRGTIYRGDFGWPITPWQSYDFNHVMRAPAPAKAPAPARTKAPAKVE